jgi:hypothetical protein
MKNYQTLALANNFYNYFICLHINKKNLSSPGMGQIWPNHCVLRWNIEKLIVKYRMCVIDLRLKTMVFRFPKLVYRTLMIRSSCPLLFIVNKNTLSHKLISIMMFSSSYALYSIEGSYKYFISIIIILAIFVLLFSKQH